MLDKVIIIYMYLSYSNGLLNLKSQTSGQGERGRPGVGFLSGVNVRFDLTFLLLLSYFYYYLVGMHGTPQIKLPDFSNLKLTPGNLDYILDYIFSLKFLATLFLGLSTKIKSYGSCVAL